MNKSLGFPLSFLILIFATFYLSNKVLSEDEWIRIGGDEWDMVGKFDGVYHCTPEAILALVYDGKRNKWVPETASGDLKNSQKDLRLDKLKVYPFELPNGDQKSAMYYSSKVQMINSDGPVMCRGSFEIEKPEGSFKIFGSDFTCNLDEDKGKLFFSMYLMKYQITKESGYINYQGKKGVPYMEFGNCSK